MQRTLVSAAVLLLLSACFESHTPLGPPGEVARGASFIGVWRCHTPTMESDEIMTITVLPFDEHQLLLELKELTLVDGVEQSSPSDIERYRFYPSEIAAKSGGSDTPDKADPQILWNAQELGLSASAPAWTFVRIKQANKSSLIAQIVQDNALQGKSEQEKLSDLRKRVSDEAIYGEAISCKRVTDAD